MASFRELVHDRAVDTGFTARAAGRGGFGLGLAFFLIVVVLVPFGVGPEGAILAKIAAGVLWVGALLACLLSLDRIFALDYEDGSLDLLATAPIPMEGVVAIKALAHWLTTGLPLVIAAPLFGVLLHLEGQAAFWLTLSLAIGTPALSILELRAKCRKLKAQHDIQMVVIDYLQLMSGDSKSGGQGGNREQEIASISRALKKIAKELSIPVIALSQLSRAVETRGGDKRPQLSDLRESGAIEQDADMVMFLYRPEYYGITEDEGGGSTAGVGEVIIAKHRNGSLENVKLRFIGRYTKFTDLDGGINYPPNQAGEVGYTTKFTSSASGVSSFDSGQTIKMSSKANEDDIDRAFSGGSDKSPF